MPTPRIRIVHISDLHLGKESTQPWRMRRVLGRAWVDNLKAIADDGPVDLLCFTGDVAQSGKAEQYAEAQEFVHTALEILCLPPERFFCVPGNHDVDRSINKPAWESLRNAIGAAGRGAAEGVSKWMAGGAVPFGFQAEWREAVLARQAAYQAWLGQIGRSALLPGPGLLGWRVSLDLGHSAPLHLIGLDSAWLAGDDHDATKLLLTADQIGGLCADEQGDPLQGPLVALMHHPVDELADGREARRLLAEHGVSLILHGHLHEPEHADWNTPSQGLRLSAAGCLYEGTKFPNSLQVLDLAPGPQHTLQAQRLWARAWSARGHWHNDDSLYPGSQNGRVLLAAPPAPTLPLANDLFVGREEQIKALKAALLPANNQETQAVVVCCAIEGMAGVGKTRLAEEFVTQHWLPHWGLPLQEGMAHHVVRLALSSEGAPPSTQDLAQTVADRLRLAGPIETVFERVANGLRHGPQSKPRLLWLENVDTQALADAVAPLRHHLKGCPLLVTARFQRLGSNEWQRVPVKPMEDEEALQMLHSQLDELASARIQPVEALLLVSQLGGLPLALHIAASHLNLGHTVQSFLKELTDAGLGLPPAHSDDPALLADHARAIIRYSFGLSWQHWCAQNHSSWQYALVALAHVPASSMGFSLAAAVADLNELDWIRFAQCAQRSSLIQISPASQRISLHPLISEFLRARKYLVAPLVNKRLTGWFHHRISPNQKSIQSHNWAEVSNEPDSLEIWLDQIPIEEGLQLYPSTSDFAVVRGPHRLWFNFFTRLIEEARDPKLISGILSTMCQISIRVGDIKSIIDCANRKINLDTSRIDQYGVAIAMATLAEALQRTTQIDLSSQLYSVVIDSLEKIGARREVAIYKGKLADILQIKGQFQEALTIRFIDQLPTFEALGDIRETAIVYGRIASIFRDQGKINEALDLLNSQVIPAYNKLGDVRSAAISRNACADIHFQRNSLDEALEIFCNDTLPFFQRIEDHRSIAITQGKIADIYAARHQMDDALRLQMSSVDILKGLGDSEWVALGQLRLAELLIQLGKEAEGISLFFDQALPVLRALGNPRLLVAGLTNVASTLARYGGATVAPEIEDLLKDAHAIATEAGLSDAPQIESLFQQIFRHSLRPAH